MLFNAPYPCYTICMYVCGPFCLLCTILFLFCFPFEKCIGSGGKWRQATEDSEVADGIKERERHKETERLLPSCLQIWIELLVA